MNLLNKKWPGAIRTYLMIKKSNVIMLVIAVFLLSYIGVAFGSSGSEHDSHGPKGWVATDTYRVMNFAVLAIGLFLLLRKPASQALNARIKGIKDQLSELEAKKKEAEENLAQYNERLLLLDNETGKIINEYIKQGNEAKVRILEEAKSAAEKLQEQARRNIAHEFELAKSKLQKEILEKALVKAKELINSKITTKDQDRLVNEYLKHLDKVVA